MIRSRFLPMCAVFAVAASAAHAQSETPKLSSFIFPPGLKRGAMPYEGLLRWKDDVYLGSTLVGGSCRKQYIGCGTVYRIRPPADGMTWRQKVLHAFDGQSEGHLSYSRLALGKDGALYGTTCQGGSNDAGVVFKLTPPADAAGTWTETVIHNFGGASAAPAAQRLNSLPQARPASEAAQARAPSLLASIAPSLLASAPTPDGSCPTGQIVFGKDGALYGTTNLGGTAGLGVVYKLVPPSSGDLWTETVLHSFQGAGAGDGANPFGGVALGADSALYGTTTFGGNANCGSQGSGCGTVYRLPLSGGSPTVVKSFTGPDGANPLGTVGLVNYEKQVSSIYGTTLAGGASTNCDRGCGTLFKITPAGVHSVVHSFSGTDGAEPASTPYISKKHISFGTAFTGTTPETQSGVVYALHFGGAFSILHRFKPDGSEGANPINLSGLTPGDDGGMYGTTYNAKGGPGAVFRLK